MTTDELRTWMKALEERDVRIVALEKRLAALEAFAQPPRMVVREDDTGLRRWLTERHTVEAAETADDKAFRERVQEAFGYKRPQLEEATDDGKPLPFNREHPVHALEAARGRRLLRPIGYHTPCGCSVEPDPAKSLGCRKCGGRGWLP